MYRQFYSGMPWTDLPVLALLLFFAVFVAVIVRVSRKSRREALDIAARLPFDGNERTGGAEANRRSERRPRP